MTHVRPSNRYAATVRTRSLALAPIVREVRRRQGVESGFVTCDTAFPAVNDTLFRVYARGNQLFFAVCILHTYHREEGGIEKPRDSIEILFDPYHDHLGYFQFVFAPGKEVRTYHHLPYPDAHSTSFRRVRAGRHSWSFSQRRNPLDGVLFTEQWLFARFNADEVLRNGPVCGFNVVRNWIQGREPSSWNPATGVGFPDATAFGHLHRRPPPCVVTVDEVQRHGGTLNISGHSSGRKTPNVMTLRDPLGRDIPVILRGRKKRWRASVQISDRLAGRYRLCACSDGRPVEPHSIALDLEWPRRRTAFTLGMTIDTVDDLIFGTYTPKILEEEMALLASRGIGRIYWIDYRPSWLEAHGTLPDLTRNARRSRRNCGDLLPRAATLAARQGIEFIGVYKPFDIAHFAPNPAWTLQSNRDWWSDPDFPIRRIRLYSTAPIPSLRASEIRIRQSRDNTRYTMVRRPFRLSAGRLRRPHVRLTPAGPMPDRGESINHFIELSNLDISQPYVAIEILKPYVSFGHAAFALIEASGPDGQRVPVIPANAGDRRKGFSFWQEWATWRNRSPRLLEELAWGTGDNGLWFAQPRPAPGLLEPAFEQSRAFWLDAVRRILETDALGVDIRTLCHHNSPIDYMTLAFAEPVRAAFQSRFGREPTPSPQDCERVRRLRGEFYTDFMRDARRIASALGKKLIAHFECGFEVPPTMDQRMQFHLDWETWLGEGLIDEITLKWWSSQNPFIHETVLPTARRLGIPVHLCDRNASLLTPRATERAVALARQARAAGFAGLHFYEWVNYKYWTAENVPCLQNQVDAALREAAAAVGRV